MKNVQSYNKYDIIGVIQKYKHMIISYNRKKTEEEINNMVKDVPLNKDAVQKILYVHYI